MSDSLCNIIVIGASGNLGRPTVNALLAKKQFKVSALTRVSSSATFPGEVTVIKTDYTHASLVSAFKGQDAIVCTIATSNLTDQKRVIDAAVEAGVKRFIPSEFGWDTSGAIALEIAPCTSMKIDTVAYLKGKEGAGMSWTSICNGLWADWCCSVRDWPWWNVKNRTFTRFDDGEAAFEASTTEQVGKAIASLLLPDNLEATRNTYVYIHSYTLTQNNFLEILKRTSGDEDWTVSPNKVKDVCNAGQEIFFRLTKDKSLDELGDVPEFQMAIVLMISSGCFGLGGVNQFSSKTKYWMDKLGLEEEDPEITIGRAVREIEATA